MGKNPCQLNIFMSGNSTAKKNTTSDLYISFDLKNIVSLSNMMITSKSIQWLQTGHDSPEASFDFRKIESNLTYKFTSISTNKYIRSWIPENSMGPYRPNNY